MKQQPTETYDARIDRYIEKAPSFAQPVLVKMRAIIHKACPQVTETLKWGMPSFDYKGPMFSMAAFKQHCVGGFWKAGLLVDPKGYIGRMKSEGGEAMGNFGRMTSVNDLPPEKYFINLVVQHMKLNEEGIKPVKKIAKKKELIVPLDLKKEFKKSNAASLFFESLSASHKREYVEWINEAKTEVTRARRILQTIAWCSEGKSKNWKYRS